MVPANKETAVLEVFTSDLIKRLLRMLKRMVSKNFKAIISCLSIYLQRKNLSTQTILFVRTRRSRRALWKIGKDREVRLININFLMNLFFSRKSTYFAILNSFELWLFKINFDVAFFIFFCNVAQRLVSYVVLESIQVSHRMRFKIHDAKN